MRKPKSPMRRKLKEIDHLYNYWLPRTPIERLANLGNVSACRLTGRYFKAFKFFGSCCDRYGVSEAAAYIGINREDGAWVFRCYRKHFNIDQRLDLLKVACNRVSRLYHD